jgi:predicted O-methyltransferase YrrM
MVMTWYPSALYRRPVAVGKYLLFDRETTNFTYDIANREELARLVGQLFGQGNSEYVWELEADSTLRAHLNERLRARKDRNPIAHYGRRAGWYAIVRGLRPKLVIESGVHDGLGSVVLLRALQRNADEGAPGRLIGIDIDPLSGWLVPGDMSSQFNLVVGDSLEVLPQLLAEERADLFIHDSDHRFPHQWAEYTAVIDRLSPRAVLLCDDASPGCALEVFAREHARPYFAWKEQPIEHFYGGTTLGISPHPVVELHLESGA